MWDLQRLGLEEINISPRVSLLQVAVVMVVEGRRDVRRGGCHKKKETPRRDLGTSFAASRVGDPLGGVTSDSNINLHQDLSFLQVCGVSQAVRDSGRSAGRLR